ncbi:hypothetical protein IKF87_01635 [Candidatus Saccharibacteria bacterium]|nr:hypothetical protein [Candidatus Saccharibacteria bacterium]
MDYFEKLETNPYQDLEWNIPEQKSGRVNIIGGNAGNFRTEIKNAEFLSERYPIETVNVIMPDALKNKLPPLPNFIFLPSTDSGTFAESQELIDVFNTADYNLLLGDLSKNSVTGKAISHACKNTERMTLITRDAVDMITDNNPERLLMNENLVFFASVAQLQKLLRAVYYPKMLILSQSVVQVAETLHKFTLSYPVSIVTLHNEQLLVAENGTVKAIALDNSGYSPVMLWGGELATKIAALNLYNPNNFISATCAAIFG